MRSALARFERERRIHVNLEVIPFDGAWTRMIQIALYGDGPAVSEIGSSWLSDMVMMNALRALGEKEVEGWAARKVSCRPAGKASGRSAIC